MTSFSIVLMMHCFDWMPLREIITSAYLSLAGPVAIMNGGRGVFTTVMRLGTLRTDDEEMLLSSTERRIDIVVESTVLVTADRAPAA